MKKVYGVKFIGTGNIYDPLFEDRAEAVRVAERLNKETNRVARFINRLQGFSWRVIDMRLKGVE